MQIDSMYGYRAAKTFILLLSKEIVNHEWSLKKGSSGTTFHVLR